MSVLVHVRVMVGRRYMFLPNGRVTLEKEWAPVTTGYPLQSIVKDIKVHDEQFSSYRDIESVFPVGSTCYMLGHPCYGCTGEVLYLFVSDVFMRKRFIHLRSKTVRKR